MGRLTGKIALVTGASRRVGIGAAIARELAKAGADVFVTFFRPYDEAMPWGSRAADIEDLLEEMRALGVRAAGLEVDLSECAASTAVFDEAERALGPINVLVNNAAHSERDGIDALDAAGLDRHYAINVRAPALLCAQFARRQGARAGGRIINITSGQGMTPMPTELAYAASKGALEALTLSLSAALASQNVTVNAVDPGPTDTGWMTDDDRRVLVERAPGGRIGRPSDVARLVCFLACDDAAWVTGQVIRSRGGM